MRDLIMKAIEEERACAEDGYDWLLAEAIGRSSETLAVAERLSVEEECGCVEDSPAEVIGHSSEALAVAEQLSVSNDLIERTVAAHVLATFVNGNDNRSQVKEAVAILTRMLEQGGNLYLEWSIVDALGLAWDSSALEPLLSQSQSHSANIRMTVAMGLPGAMVDGSTPAGIQALIGLMDDADTSVRDWATFGLAYLEEDSPEIRTALWARVEDPDYDTRCEALVGLTCRHELAVTWKIVAELGAESVGSLVVEAARNLAQPALLESLQALEAWWDVDPQLLEQAIQACRPEKL